MELGLNTVWMSLNWQQILNDSKRYVGISYVCYPGTTTAWSRRNV